MPNLTIVDPAMHSISSTCQPSPRTKARSTCACCAVMFRWFSTSTTIVRVAKPSFCGRQGRADHFVRVHDDARAGSGECVGRSVSMSRSCIRRRSSRSMKKIQKRLATAERSRPRTIRSSAGWARRSPVSVALRGGSAIPADRLAGCVSRRRRPADAARSLRHLGGAMARSKSGCSVGAHRRQFAFAARAPTMVFEQEEPELHGAPR